MAAVDRHAVPPFSLRLVYRTGAFHRPEEFEADSLPPHLTIHTWSDCTLSELATHLAAASPPLLPGPPSIGTRLSFRLVYPDTRHHAGSPQHHAAPHAVRFLVKVLGSVVVGDGGPGLDPDDPDAAKTLEPHDARKTLADARFVIGDLVSVAILPPLPDGHVAPASDARSGRGVGVGEALPPAARPLGPPGRPYRENGFSRARGGRGGVPAGEWRRGERLPDPPPTRARGNGRDWY